MGQMRTQLNVGSFQREKKSCCLKVLTSSLPEPVVELDRQHRESRGQGISP
jgi:hypothetical protein